MLSFLWLPRFDLRFSPKGFPKAADKGAGKRKISGTLTNMRRQMRRTFIVLLMVMMTSGLAMAAPKNFDQSLQKRIDDFKRGKKNGPDKVRVIIQTAGDPDEQGISNEVLKGGGKAFGKFETFGGLAAEIPVSQLEKMSSHRATLRISEDVPVNGTTDYSFDVNAFLAGVDAARVATGAPDAWFKYGVTGKKVGIAVLDSGIAPVYDLSTEIAQTVDMVTGSTTAVDPFGHGTHVAGILGGLGMSSKFKYLGVAPKASIFNVRVLDDNGRGLTSTVIKGIEWAIKNRNGKQRDGVDIRVINLSLGHAPTESASTDPLTLACRKAVAAGIVVVTAAGNYGKDSNGNPVYGGITSPGTEPSVITVGAINTHGSLNRSDDTVASYSSKGPTIDGIIKPDIVAPGSNIVAPMAPQNKLVKLYPALAQDAYYMKLSGTSMAAPIVAGAVAMILERNPALTPNAVKAILMYTAERMNNNPLEAGAGYLNVLGAVNLATSIDPTKAFNQYWITNGGLGLTQVDTTLSGYSIVWGHTIVWDDALYTGNNILYNQSAWGTTVLWGAKTNWSTTIVWDTDLATLNGAIQGQTIVWDEALTIVWDENLTIVWDVF